MTTTVRPATRPRVHPPGPPRTAAPRLFWQLVTDRLRLLSSSANEYGDAVRLVIGPKTLYLFNHPDHAKHVLADNAANYHKGLGLSEAKRALGEGLLTAEGDEWRGQRRAVQPAFRNKRLTEQSGAIADEAERLVDRLRRHENDTVDVLGEVTAFTLGVFGRTLLDSDMTGFDSVGHAFEAVQDQAMFEMVTLGKVPFWLPLPKHLRFRAADRELRRVVDRLVEARSRRERGDDVLSRLVEAVPSNGDARRRLQHQIVTLLLAGHETTASTLGWTFHSIAQHPEVFERLRAEAREVLGDRAPTAADLRSLPYTTMVLHEVLRCYPPVWGLTRRALAEDEIGGYHVPAGAEVMICPYTLHRNPAFWPEPEKFDPERFDPDRHSDRPQFAYLPFGAGPRFCVGNHLGIMEAVFAIAMVTREMRLEPLPGHRVVADPMLSLRLRGGLPMRVVRA